MPLTQYHLGPGLFFGIILLGFLDLPTFLIASVIIDIEPLWIYYNNLGPPLHGFFHSFLGGTIIGIILSGIMFLLRKIINPIMSFFKLEQDRSFVKILLASLLGIYIHIIFDSLMHSDIKPFYPLNFNPFRSYYIELEVSATILCQYFFFAGLFAYMIRLTIYYWKRQLRVIYMEPSNKLMLSGISLISIGSFFMLWCLLEILSAESSIRITITIILYIIIPFTIPAIISDYMDINKVIRKKKELELPIVKNRIYNCVDCGAKMTLEVKNCNECGAENAIRNTILERIEDLEGSLEETRKKVLEKEISPSKKKSVKLKYQNELEDKILSNLKEKAKELLLLKTILLTVNSQNEKLSWVKTQYYEKNKSIIEIASELGEDMFIIEDSLDELKNQEKNRYKN
ncbi:MAG: metal-dependent hydrolase [Promethearchaeota archaeon]|nr:MAG: metal-dependent hydrolase [Candidatus Lokiarchaeota archaeon]